MLKSPAKITSFCEISRFEREFLILILCDQRLVDDELNLAQYFSNFCFQLRNTNIRMLWNLPGDPSWICVNKFLAKKYRALLPWELKIWIWNFVSLKRGFWKANCSKFEVYRFTKILKSFKMFLHASNNKIKNTKWI